MTAPVTVTVEMFLGGAWTDITSYVRLDPGLEIVFGVQAENATADANTCNLVVNNRDGRFTPKNTAGAYYGNLKRNTPLRVKVGSTVRFLGEVSEFPSRWNPNSTDVWVPLVASGILRRLLRATSLDSTLTTAVQILAAANGDITGYWPCEDGVGSTSIASALEGDPVGVPGDERGSMPVFAAVDLSAGTHEVPTWNLATGTFYPGPGSGSTEFTAGFYVKLPETGLTGGEELFRVNVAGVASSWRVLYSPTNGGGLFAQVIKNDEAGTELLATGNNGTNLDGKTFYVKFECSNSGANVAYAFSLLGEGTTLSGTINTASVGAPTVAYIGAGVLPIAADVAIGHVVLGNSDTALFHSDFDDGRSGYDGETVEARLSRLAAQHGVSISVTSGADSPVEMGVQPDGTLLEVLRAAEKADAGGILRDNIGTSGDAPTLAYITRNGRYNDQRTQLALNYNSGHLSPPLEPTDDDQQLRNIVKANRQDGSSAIAELSSGALSSADYPSGVGPYQFEDTYAVYSDDQLPYLASWVLRLGTVDETRFPAVTVDLVKNSSLVTDAEALRPGHRVRITNLPAHAGATDVDLQVVGWRENISSHRRAMTLICTPGTPWFVFELNDAVFGVLDVNYLAY